MKSESHLTFCFEGFDIPVFVDKTLLSWLHAASVCNALNLKNPTVVVQRHVNSVYRRQIAVGVGMPAWYITEPGLYQLVFRSKSEPSERFQQWVFEEVLPAVRSQGAYISPDITNEQLSQLKAQVAQLEADKELLSRGFLNMAHASTTDPKVEREVENMRSLLPSTQPLPALTAEITKAEPKPSSMAQIAQQELTENDLAIRRKNLSDTVKRGNAKLTK